MMQWRKVLKKIAIVGLTGACIALILATLALAQAKVQDPLPSWNDGPTKQAIVEFVRLTTDEASPKYVAPEARIAAFDQDGTLWVEHPLYTQVMFALDRVLQLAPKHPEWKNQQPFKAVIAGDRAAMDRFTMEDIEAIIIATHSGMTTGAFQAVVKDWIAQGQHRRWNRPYTELVYQPMLEVMQYLRSNGYRTYIVTGAGQDFVRAYADRVYGIPPEQVIGTALETRFSLTKDGRGILIRAPKLMLHDNFSGKPEDIYLFTGRRPQAAFGNSTGDRQMLEYASGSREASLSMLVLHDDGKREYAYGPAEGLPDTKVGTFSEALMAEARQRKWFVISMKNDWKKIFAWE